MIRAGWGIAIAVGLASAACLAQPAQQAQAYDFDAQATQAYRAKDYARFLELEQRALAADPQNPRWAYDVACGEALRGDASAAVRLLNGLVARQIDYGATTDTDFSKIRDTPDWRDFLARLEALRKPVERSQVAFTLDDPGLVATGVAANPRTGDVYVSSVRERKIVRRTRNGHVSDFIRPAQDGFLGGGGLAIDARRGLLYASTSAVPFIVDYQKEDAGKSGVFAFDLKTGKTVRQVWLTGADAGQHFLNNMVVQRDGTVLVSDSAAPSVYRWRPGRDALELLPWSKPFRSTQGLALSSDEKTLYLTDWSDGVWAVNLASGERRLVEGPAGVWLGGLDGLTPVRDGFVAVQIGIKPDRLLRLHLDRAGTKITSVDVLEQNRGDYSEPVQGASDGKDYLYVANSQLNLVDGATGTFPVDRAKATVVLRMKLE